MTTTTEHSRHIAASGIELREQLRHDAILLNGLARSAETLNEERRLTEKAAAVALIELVEGPALESGDLMAIKMVAAQLFTRIYNFYPVGSTREGFNLVLDRLNAFINAAA